MKELLKKWRDEHYKTMTMGELARRMMYDFDREMMAFSYYGKHKLGNN